MKLDIKVNVDKLDQKFIYVLETAIHDLVKDLSEYSVEKITMFDVQFNVDDTEFTAHIDYDPK